MPALRRYLLVATLLLGGLLCGSLTGLALARADGHRTPGVREPGNPPRYCTGWDLAAIEQCGMAPIRRSKAQASVTRRPGREPLGSARAAPDPR